MRNMKLENVLPPRRSTSLGLIKTAHVLNNSGHQLFTIDRKSRKFDYDKTTRICYKNVGFIMFICYIILLVFDLFV